MPLYRLMRKMEGPFKWTSEATDALAALKKVLSESPLMAAPKPREPMLMYIAATNRVVSIILVVEREEDGQRMPSSAPHLLPQRGPHRVQAKVPSISEDGIRRL